MTKIFKDKDGIVINIGDWDYMEMPDADGNMVVTNPLPTGAVESQETVTTAADGSRVAASDYMGKRRAEYPSVQDQLDKMFNDGFDAWKDDIQAIKDRHPKP